jgi:hypothetical protein
VHGSVRWPFDIRRMKLHPQMRLRPLFSEDASQAVMAFDYICTDHRFLQHQPPSCRLRPPCFSAPQITSDPFPQEVDLRLGTPSTFCHLAN